ncbi:TPR/MLP1/MLP2-like protein-domain-containing protein [Phellopilus nigrolimitatus]|nr:TPR/MLP1/MLP2-like protein-domain-containing protein [Phellopilus nigrolimitatus]
MQGELNRLNERNADLQQTLERERAAFAQDKKTLEDTIVDITNAEMNTRTDQASRESDVREQMERAKAAEEKYSREVVAHAESIKMVDSLKREINEARATVREKIMLAETAQANIAASEGSWKQQKEALDKEVSDLNSRYKDLVAQNAMLHQHLEAVNSQASRIRQAADSAVNVTHDSSEADDVDGRMAELRSVVAYLRKEKEIVDLQLELSKQENARLKTQMDHLAQSLEETRTTLSNEREQAVNSVESSAEHTELLERINQLNILRESNATLRAESDAHARKARQLESTLNQLRTELGPVKEEARILRAELEEKERQTHRLEDENRQWKERNSQLLTKVS